MNSEQEENQGSAYAEIKRRCKALKIGVSTLCKKKNVDYTSLHRWKKKDPKSLETYRKLLEGLDELENPSKTAE